MTRRYSRQRFAVYAVVVSLGMTAVLGRLVQIQLVQHSRYVQAKQGQSLHLEEVPSRRGALLDRLGYPLALSEECVKVGVTDPRAWMDEERSDALGNALGISGRRVRRALRGREGHTYVVKSAFLEPSVLDSLSRVAGLSVEAWQRRRYPMDGLAARLLGRVNHQGRGDAGIERLCDDILAGRPGQELCRYDAKGGAGAVERTPVQPPVAGQDVVLTLDHRVQEILEGELEATVADAGAQSAMGVVMDPWTGEILAMATAPGIGSRDGRPYVSEFWRDATVLDAFEPGSSFKLFTMASLLTRALCDTSEVWDGEGHPSMHRCSADMGGFLFHDVHPVGEVSVRVAFTVSSNIILGKLSSLLQREEFHGDLRRYGFGRSTGCGLPGETAGILRPAESWSGRSQPTLAIGHEVSVGLLQLVAGYAALLTDGTLRAPRFVAQWSDGEGRVHDAETTVIREGLAPPSVIQTLRALCKGVVHEKYGTGIEASVPDLSVGGKTGTAQVSEEGVRGYVPDAYVANFVGVVPAENPRLLCAIVVNRPEVEKRWGGTTAASCFSRVISKVMSGTEHLDREDVVDRVASDTVPKEAELRSVPDLIGQKAERILASATGSFWRLANQPPSLTARAVGQVPPAGARIPGDGVIRIAWAKGGGS